MTTTRTFRPTQNAVTPLSKGLQYDIERAIALYGRHSSKEQNGNVATTQQTIGLERFALNTPGFVKELHRTFYEDLKGVSAYKVPMDERKSYSDLYNAIVRGEVGTVVCYMVDRLFRTRNGEEWELFINACAKNNVKVITTAPSMRVYDLSLSSDADEFRRKCIAARTYIEEIIKGRLNAARDELGRIGLWCGYGMPMGYYVDLDDTSETYRQFFIYEPHAEIIRAIFKRYRELSGAFSALMREVEARQPFFPLFEGLDTLPNVQVLMNTAKTGYVLGCDGLVSILTNPMYIGIHTYQGQKIVDNHAPIVEREDFFYAFDRLSRYDLDGNEKETTRTRDNGYGSVEALLRGKLTSPAFTHVYAHSPQKIYVFQQKSHSFALHNMRVPIALLDGIVSTQLVSMLTMWRKFEDTQTYSAIQAFRSKTQEIQSKVQEVKSMLGDTFPLGKLHDDLDAYTDTSPFATFEMPYNAFEMVRNAPETVIASVDDQLPALRARIAKLRRNLDLDADEETLASWAKELKDKVTNLARIEAKQKAIAASQSAQEEATELIARVPDEWDRMKFERKQRAIELLLDTVEVVGESAHFLRVAITWKLPIAHTKTLYVWRHDGTSYAWTSEEEDIVREHYPKTTMGEMLQLLPRRSWATIKRQAVSLQLHRTCGAPCTIPITLTMQDIAFMKAHRITSLDLKASVQVFYGDEDKDAYSWGHSRV